MIKLQPPVARPLFCLLDSAFEGKISVSDPRLRVRLVNIVQGPRLTNTKMGEINILSTLQWHCKVKAWLCFSTASLVFILGSKTQTCH